MGARKSFIKRPYIWKSFKIGLLVGVLTILLVMLAVYTLSRTYPEIWKVFLEDSFLLWALTVLSFSLLFNVLSTWVILSSFLKGRLQFS
jgi:cell division transport system permease protein